MHLSLFIAKIKRFGISKIRRYNIIHLKARCLPHKTSFQNENGPKTNSFGASFFKNSNNIKFSNSKLYKFNFKSVLKFKFQKLAVGKLNEKHAFNEKFSNSLPSKRRPNDLLKLKEK